MIREKKMKSQKKCQKMANPLTFGFEKTKTRKKMKSQETMSKNGKSLDFWLRKKQKREKK